MPQPIVLDTINALRIWRNAERRAGKRVGLVPTMGALHQGHISLVNAVREEAESVVTSIFVNPIQFAPHEDFSKYPRAFERDLELLGEVDCDAVFAPSVSEMYPEGFATAINLVGPAAVGLEDKFRPTHFTGVATVVGKLLLQALPEVAVFGEKDFQQLAVIRRMVRDLDMGVEILGAPTLREADGLAMSSRNVYLSAQEREKAVVIHQTLLEAAEAAQAGMPLHAIEKEAEGTLSELGFVVDYVAIRDSVTLAEPVDGAKPGSLRILAAAKLGQTRLIDNIAVG
ncbi:MAG: pantoate--beta-alanine ligase [Rhizobiales bacterium]|nr:pantoate--beta-alanine ligase [Hyphomicrobiales bacterium]